MSTKECETWTTFREAVKDACGGESEGNGCWENAEANYIGSSINKQSISGSCILYSHYNDSRFPNYIGFDTPLPENTYLVKLTECCACIVEPELIPYRKEYFFSDAEYHIRCNSRPIKGTSSIENTLERKKWYAVRTWLTGNGEALGKLQVLLSSRANNLLTKNTTITCAGGSCLGSDGGNTDEYVTLPEPNNKGVFSHGLAWFGRLSISKGMTLYMDNAANGQEPRLTDFNLIAGRIPREIQAIEDTASKAILNYPEGSLDFQIKYFDQYDKSSPYYFSCDLNDIELTSEPTDPSFVGNINGCIPTTYTLKLPGCLKYIPSSDVVYMGKDTFKPIEKIIEKLREFKTSVAKIKPDGEDCEEQEAPEEEPPIYSGSECLNCSRPYFYGCDYEGCYTEEELKEGIDNEKVSDSIDFSKKKCGLYHIETYASIPPLDESEINYGKASHLECAGPCGDGEGACCHSHIDADCGECCWPPSDKEKYEDEEKEKLWGDNSSDCLCEYPIGGTGGAIYTINPSKKEV